MQNTDLTERASSSRPIALVTGASSGIGEALAKQFASQGYDLVLVARREDLLQALAAELQASHGAHGYVHAADLTSPGAAQQLFDAMQAQDLPIEVLVNNAGFGARGAFHKLPLERQREMVQLNVMVTTELTRLFLPSMVARDQGGVLNIGSASAFQPGPFMAIYFASKAYLLSFSEAVAEELRLCKVTVSCICPGHTKTEFEEVAGLKGTTILRFGQRDAATVARIAYRGFQRGKVVIFPGWAERVSSFLARRSPRGIVRRVVRWLHS